MREGAKVLIADINLAQAEAAVAEIDALGFPGATAAGQVNVSIYKEVEAVVALAVKTFGKLDIIFNNAGIAGGKPLLDHDPEVDYMPMIRVDQDGVYYGILAAGRQFRDQRVSAWYDRRGSVHSRSSRPAEVAPSGGLFLALRGAPTRGGWRGRWCRRLSPQGREHWRVVARQPADWERHRATGDGIGSRGTGRLRPAARRAVPLPIGGRLAVHHPGPDRLLSESPLAADPQARQLAVGSKPRDRAPGHAEHLGHVLGRQQPAHDAAASLMSRDSAIR